MRRLPRRWLVVVVAALVMGSGGTYQFGWSQSFYFGAVLLVLAGLGALALRPVRVDALTPATTGDD